MHKIIRIKNLDCANCAAELSEELAAVAGVSAASADFINQKVSLDYEGEEALQKCIYLISHFEKVEIIDGNAPQKKDRHLPEVLSISIAAALFLPALVLRILGLQPWVSFSLFVASALAAGWAVLWKVALNIPRIFRGGFHPSVLLDENLLMTIAAAGAFAIGENLEGAAVMLLYEIGELLQNIAVGSSRSSITRLLSLKSDTAIRLLSEGQEEVDPEELSVGDVILIRRGDKIPVDYTFLKHVKKPKGSKAGFVTYTAFKTLLGDPEGAK